MKRILQNILLSALAVLPLPSAFGEVFISVNFAPPPLPIYVQPVCPGDGYIWLPGYWAWDPDAGYYWVPGYWMTAPEIGFFWTPPWWGWQDGVFVFNEGYWGPQVGFYGGIDYGFGYFGTGFAGGRWDGGHFFYNAAVLNVGGNIHNTYRDTTIINNTTIVNNHVSYNGGEGGITARPSAAEETYAHEQHFAPSAAQTAHLQAARSNPQMRASVNQGRPAIAATSRPGSFSGRGVVAASAAGGEYHSPAGAPGGTARSSEPGSETRPAQTYTDRGATPTPTPAHAADLQPHQPEQLQSTGNAKLDQKYQKQQQKMIDQQNKEHQQLMNQQQKEDQQLQKRNASQAEKQQVEQKHQQQTQQMEQRHTQQTQDFHDQVSQPRPPRH